MAADEEHLGQVSQAELVAQRPEHHEGDVGGIPGSVQQAGNAFVELLAAGAAAGPAVTLTVRSGRSETADKPHAHAASDQLPPRDEPIPPTSLDRPDRLTRTLTESRVPQRLSLRATIASRATFSGRVCVAAAICYLL
jgi:hypothetical protein